MCTRERTIYAQINLKNFIQVKALPFKNLIIQTHTHTSLVAVKPGHQGRESWGQVYLSVHGQNAAAHYNALKKAPSVCGDNTCRETDTRDEVSCRDLQSTPVKCAPSFCPESVRPFPKAQPRSQTTKGRKKRKCTIPTNTPEKQALEAEQSMKANKTKTAKKGKETKVPYADWYNW